MNLLILMGGSSKSFFEAGYKYPKPLIEVSGTPILELVVEKLKRNYIKIKKYYCLYSKRRKYKI